MTRRMSVSECAEIMGVSPQFIRIGLQQGRLPFGYAVKQSNTKWTYYINRSKFLEEMGMEK